MVLRDAPLDQVRDHHFGIDMGDAAVRVPDDHDLLHAQLHNAHQQAPHGAVKGTGDHTPGVFDHLHIAVFDAQSRRKQLYQAGVHAGQDGDFFVRVFAGGEFLIFFILHKFPVIGQHLFDHKQAPFRLFCFMIPERLKIFNTHSVKNVIQ